jgi:diguanylate cyclase (GGDEF)-like protein
VQKQRATGGAPTVALDFRRPADRQAVALPTLRVVGGPDMLRFCSVYIGYSVTIGRDGACELPLVDNSISRRHAKLSRDHSGAISVEDLGSTNGTTVNGRRVRGATLVRPGDVIGVGGVMLRLELLGMEELAHLQRVVERLNVANRDPLTGLNSRWFLEQDLPEVARRHVHTGVPLSALMLDVDRFKGVNDRSGHPVGDAVLQAVARLLVLSVRHGDVCVRYGGDELLVVLPDCDEDAAVGVAERIRGAVGRHDWEHYAPELRVTVSLGVAELRKDEDAGTWLGRADRALYAAKQGGRNKVVRFTD